MFKSHIYKDAKRSEDQKRTAISRNDLFTFKYGESRLPYFELIPERVLSDSRYAALSRQDKGDFLRFVILLWLEECKYVRFSLAIAHKMEMEVGEWESLEERLLKAKLIEVAPDGIHLVQLELREQYLMNRQSNNNKKRHK